MHPLFDCSVPHPYKPGYRMRPHDAVRLPVPMGIPGVYAWVSPAFFAYARATPSWFAAEERRGLDIPMALFGHPLFDLERPEPGPSGEAGLVCVCGAAAAREVTHG